MGVTLKWKRLNNKSKYLGRYIGNYRVDIKISCWRNENIKVLLEISNQSDRLLIFSLENSQQLIG